MPSSSNVPRQMIEIGAEVINGELENAAPNAVLAATWAEFQEALREAPSRHPSADRLSALIRQLQANRVRNP